MERCEACDGVGWVVRYVNHRWRRERCPECKGELQALLVQKDERIRALEWEVARLYQLQGERVCGYCIHYSENHTCDGKERYPYAPDCPRYTHVSEVA